MYTNRKIDTLRKNQKAPDRGGTLIVASPAASVIEATQPRSPPRTPPANMKRRPLPERWSTSHPRKPPRASGPSTSQPFSSQARDGMPGNGRSQPPKNRMVAIDDTTIMFVYSARKKNANFMPLYSVWKPATSSASASGKSNGTRLVSATAEMK